MSPVVVSVVPGGEGVPLTRQALRKAVTDDQGIEISRLIRKPRKRKKACWQFHLPKVEAARVEEALEQIQAHPMGLLAKRVAVKAEPDAEPTDSAPRRKRRNSVKQSPMKLEELMSRVTAIFDISTDDMETVLMHITKTVCMCVNAERASVFFVDKKSKELYSKVFDLPPGLDEQDADGVSEEGADQEREMIRFSVKEGIAGHVASTGESLLLADAYKDERFNKDIDKLTGFRTKSIVCVPLRHNEEILGTVQAINNASGSFSQRDLKILETFARLSSIAIFNRRLHLRSVELETRGRLALQMLIRHTVPEKHTLDAIVAMANEGRTIEDLASPSLMCREISDVESVFYVYQMFESIGLISFFDTSKEKTIRLILTVKSNYRDVPYHNWRHAFEVMQACYSIIVNAKLKELFSERQVYALLIAALVHDVDHRGRNNTFIVSAENEMMSAYGKESTLEQHHYAVFLSLISPDELNIFLDTNEDNRDWVTQAVQKIILATDLSSHFPALGRLKKMEKLNLKKRSEVDLLVSLVMTCSDLNASARPWEMHHKVTALIYEEFYEQGDVEKSLGLTPNPMMDREQADIAKMQKGFFDYVAIPAFAELARHLPMTKGLHSTTLSNAEQWEKVGATAVTKEGGNSEVVLPML